jgi:FKBP-type peptidyl-prolyl cis-trans isomerase SlyD
LDPVVEPGTPPGAILCKVSNVKIANNTVVTVGYRLLNEALEEIDTSENGAPIVYLHGGNELLDGLEAALNGKTTGDRVTVTLQPDDAYGPEDPELIQIFNIDEFTGVDMYPGMELQGKDPDGNFRLLRVMAVDDDNVTVNMNHPLAGLVLSFELHVEDVRAATEEELAHGHAHGHDGHSHH